VAAGGTGQIDGIRPDIVAVAATPISDRFMVRHSEDVFRKLLELLNQWESEN